MISLNDKKVVLQDVSGEKIMNFAEAVAHGMNDIKHIADFIGVGEAQAAKIQSMAEQMGIIESKIDGFHIINSEDRTKLISSSTQDLSTLFIKYLRKYGPFAKFYHFLSLGYIPEKAAQRTCAIYGIQRDTKSALKMFKSWGGYAEVLDVQGKISIEASLRNTSLEKIDELRSAFKNAFAAQEYLNQILGEDAFNYLSNTLREEIVKAMIDFSSDPRGAIKITREVLEDFLTDYGTTVGVSMVGHGTLKNKILKLRQNKKIATKHVPILEGLEVLMEEKVMENIGAFGNLTHHGKIDEELSRWSVSGEIALCVVLETILTVKSIYLYGIKGQTEY